MSNIADALAIDLAPIFPVPTTIEVVKSADNTIIFRDDHTYYFKSESNVQQHISFDPFATEQPSILGDVYCNEIPLLCIPARLLERIKTQTYFQTVANPLLFEVVADFLTFRLNEEQSWAKLHSRCKSHVAQNYAKLELLVEHFVPELMFAYQCMVNDIELHRREFVQKLQRDRMMEIQQAGYSDLDFVTESYAMKLYEVRGKQYEDVIIQDFWDRREIQNALNEVAVSISKVIGYQFRIEKDMAERSLNPAFGYDVYQASIEGNRLVMRNLGDYRILHWELNR